MLTWFEQYATYVVWHFSACFSKTSDRPGNIGSSLHTASSSAKNVCDADNTLGTPPNNFFLSIGVRISFINVWLLRNSFSRTRREFKYDASEVRISNFASWIFFSSDVSFSKMLNYIFPLLSNLVISQIFFIIYHDVCNLRKRSLFITCGVWHQSILCPDLERFVAVDSVFDISSTYK